MQQMKVILEQKMVVMDVASMLQRVLLNLTFKKWLK